MDGKFLVMETTSLAEQAAATGKLPLLLPIGSCCLELYEFQCAQVALAAVAAACLVESAAGYERRGDVAAAAAALDDARDIVAKVAGEHSIPNIAAALDRLTRASQRNGWTDLDVVPLGFFPGTSER